MSIKGLTPSAYSKLNHAFMQLPGIGEQSAWRLTQACLQSQQGEALVDALQASSQLKRCPTCNAYSLDEVCPVCADTQRDTQAMAVVLSMEERERLLNEYQHLGHVYILPKLLMPSSGVGLKETMIPQLIKRIEQLNIKTVFALMPESSSTALSLQFLADMLKDSCNLWQVTHLDDWLNTDKHTRISGL